MTPDFDTPRAILVAFATLVAVVLILTASTSSTAFGMYNDDWDGASRLEAQIDAVGADGRIVLDDAAYASVRPTDTVALVLSPDKGYSSAKRSQLRRFVQRGGTLVVAEDFGPQGNRLLAALGAEARFGESLVRDEQHYYRSPALPVTTNASNTAVSTQRTTITLNYGTVVEPNGATVAVATSEFAYLDTDRDGRLGSTEPLRSYPVVTVERVGRGRVVAVSDPSVFTNAMLERQGNRAFVRNLFRGHGTVLLDYSGAAHPPPLARAKIALDDSPALRVGLSMLTIGAVLVWFRFPTLRERFAAARRE